MALMTSKGGGKELATLPHLTPGLVRLAVVV
jgi:hypothetical protein